MTEPNQKTNEGNDNNINNSLQSESNLTKRNERLSQTQFTIRKSLDNSSFEIVNPTINDQHLEASLSNKQTPVVKLNRIESKSPTKIPSSVIDNSLDPCGIDLISSVHSTDDCLPITTMYATEPLAKSTPTITTSIAGVNTTPPKMPREFRSLQQSTNSSKVLSTYLETSDTPRRRKQAKTPSIAASNDFESETELSNVMETESMLSYDSTMPLKSSPLSHESDSTIVLQEEDDQKRRKSLSRTRTRKKSTYKQMNEELAIPSEKEEDVQEGHEEDVDDIILPTKAFENRAPNPPPKIGWDSFCFKCHTDNAVLSLACSKCKCSYHRACVRPNPIPKNTDEFICPECRDLEAIEESSVNKFGHPKIDPNVLKDMLLTILETIRGQPERDYFEVDIPFKPTKDNNNQPLIVTQMSYKIIEERILSKYYKSSEAFIHDMKQLEHNWMIVDKSKVKTLKTVIKYIIGDINEMESCIHCYASAFVVGNWFSTACKRPHLLIWAKLKGYPYWPAKIMSIDVDKQQADVRFFGAHDRAYIPAHLCIIFCEKDPNRNNKGTPTNVKKGIADALKETDDYIKNIRALYGFEYSSSRETLDVKNFQAQLERQLPKLKSNSNQTSSVEKEADVSQKEKLTLKIVRTPDGNQKSVENRVTHLKVPEKDRHPLYRVLSRPDVTIEGEAPVKVSPLIIRRNTPESSLGKVSKRPRLDDTASETSESNLSTAGSNKSMSRKKPIRDTSKRSKSVRNVDRNLPEKNEIPNPPKVRSKSVKNVDRSEQPEEHQVEDEHSLYLDEIPPPKVVRKQQKKTYREDDAPLLVNATRIPVGTSEIHTLRVTSPITVKASNLRTKNRSRSFNRTSSHEKDAPKPIQRRMSAHAATSVSSIQSISIWHPNKSNHHHSQQQKQQLPQVIVKNKNNQRKKSADNNRFIDEVTVIKSEPTSDVEGEIMERNQITINDLAEIVGYVNSRKQKTILISTSDDDSSYQGSRARKSFPNSVASSRRGSRQSDHSNAMVRIPQVFPPTESNNRNHVNGEPNNLDRHNNRSSVVAERSGSFENMPRLVPKPSGVFTADGSNFQFETGAVSALFSENAHRMTDYFKSLLIDTIGAVSSGIPSADITLLRLENEKLKMQVQKMKSDHSLSIERLRKEFMEESNTIRQTYEEKLKKHEENAKQDKIRIESEIRALCEKEKQHAIDALKKDVKKTTWCSNCYKEARFYCCWNTSYCGTACQREHWSTHQTNCRNSNTVANSTPLTATTTTKSQIIQKRIAAPVTTQNLNPQNFTSNNLMNRPPVPIVRNVQPSITSMQSINHLQLQHQQQLVSQSQIQQLPSKVLGPTTTIIQQVLSPNINLQAYMQQSTSQNSIIKHNPPPPPLVATSTKKALNTSTTTTLTSMDSPNVIVRSLQTPNSPKINIISSGNAAHQLINNNLAALANEKNSGMSVRADSFKQISTNIRLSTNGNIISDVQSLVPTSSSSSN